LNFFNFSRRLRFALPLMQPHFRGGARNLDIRLCWSTRILNFFNFSRRLQFSGVAFCGPSSWRGAETSKAFPGGKRNCVKSCGALLFSVLLCRQKPGHRRYGSPLD